MCKYHCRYLRSGPQIDTYRPTINGALMAQYLMTLLGNQAPGVMLGAPENGRLGDYVFDQEGQSSSLCLYYLSLPWKHLALDQIITQIMENSNANRPVPASEEIVNNLPREVLTEMCKQVIYGLLICMLINFDSSYASKRLCSMQGPIQARNGRS